VVGRVGAPHRSDRLRVAPWHSSAAVALLAPVPDRGAPTAGDVARCVAELAGSGYREALTTALPVADHDAFLRHGFSVHERLHLLVHDLRDLPPRGDVPVRRARRRDRAAVLAVDAAAFAPFWQLDDDGLTEALTATPTSAFRVAGNADPCGYAIWGRAGQRGYLQRLAVRPADEGHGVGSALVVDGLRWLRRRRAARALVNTQETNLRALALYEHLGFRRQREGLAVLRLDLASHP
jgi:ribosomal protein S18 acetylase RimI-like enzyme